MVPDPVMPRLFVGIDIAAATFTAAWSRADAPVGTPRTYAQDAHGFAALQKRLATAAVSPADTLIVMEATGSPWIALAVTLHHAGYRVGVINPLGAHHFAKAQLRRAKTDAPMCKTSPASPPLCVPRGPSYIRSGRQRRVRTWGPVQQ